MKARALVTAALLSTLGLSAVSCADLLDADRCYRLAHLFCVKSCADDVDACRDALRQSCYDSSSDATALDDCADKLDALDDCAGEDAASSACSEPGLIPDATAAVGKLGDACMSGSSCAGAAYCDHGVCTTSCSFDSDCSTNSSSGTKNLCNDDEGRCRPSCSTSCKGDLTCQDVSGSGRLCAPSKGPPTPKGAAPGDTCSSFSDCDGALSSRCQLGYCADSCTSNSDCGQKNSDGFSTFCVAQTGGSGLCLPGCDVSSDCATGDTCLPTLVMGGGGGARICNKPKASGGTKQIGAACASASECAGDTPICQGYCSQTCAVPADCGSAANGQVSDCASDGARNVCMPECQSSQDCSGGSSCALTQTVQGFRSVCRLPATASQGGVGTECQIAQDCDSAQSLTCLLGMCTRACQNMACPEQADVVCATTFCTIDCSARDCPGSYTCQFDVATERDLCKPGP